jgi:HK97 family phage major capsid protein
MEEMKKMLEEHVEKQREILQKSREEDSKKIETLLKSNEELSTRVAEMEALSKQRAAQFSLPGVNEQKEKFSYLKAIGGISTGDWSNAGFEKEVFDNMKQKAQSIGSDTAGGYIIPTEQIMGVIDLLREKIVVASMGASIMDNLYGNPIEIPKQTGGTTVYWVGEGTSITESELTLGQITLSPKKVAAMVKMSNQFIRMAQPSGEALVRRDIASGIALEIDRVCLRGSGSASQPKGIANTDSINTYALSGAVPTFDTLINMEYEVELDKALNGKLGFIFHPAIKRTLIKSKVAQYSGDTAGAYIIAPTSDAELANWVGYPFKTTTQVPINLTTGGGTNLTEIYFGNWEELIIGQWAGMQLMASKETSDAFQKDQTWVRIIQEVDVAVRHPESFCLCNDAAFSVTE